MQYIFLPILTSSEGGGPMVFIDDVNFCKYYDNPFLLSLWYGAVVHGDEKPENLCLLHANNLFLLGVGEGILIFN